MFKELKHIATPPNQLQNQIELRRIAENARIDRTETCFGGKSSHTWKDYQKVLERVKKASQKWW